MGPDGSCDEQETCRGGKHKSQPEEGDVRMGKGAVGKDCQEQVCGGSDRKRDPADFFSVLQKLCCRNDQEDLCRIGIPVPVAAGFFEQGEDRTETKRSSRKAAFSLNRRPRIEKYPRLPNKGRLPQ